MPVPRLGAAGVTVSISDKDGFRVTHCEGATLAHIPADQLEKGDWDRFWAGIEDVKMTVAERQVERARVAGEPVTA